MSTARVNITDRWAGYRCNLCDREIEMKTAERFPRPQLCARDFTPDEVFSHSGEKFCMGSLIAVEVNGKAI